MDAASSTSPALNPAVAPLQAALQRLRTATRRYLVLAGSARVALVLAGLLVGQLLLDRGLRLASEQRLVVDLLVVAGLLWALVRYLGPALSAELSDVTLARLVDRAHPGLHDGLASAIELARPGLDPQANSPALIEQVLGEVTAAADRINFLGVLDHASARRRVWRFAAGGVALFLVAIFWSSGLATWFQRNWMLRDVPWPQATYLRAVGFDADRVRPAPRGEPLRIVVDNLGRIPRTARLVWQTEDGKRGEQPLTRIGALASAEAGEVTARWEANLGPLRGPLRFRLLGGDERSAEYLVSARPRPQVVALEMHVTPPAYTGMPEAVFRETAALEILARSTLRVRARLNKPVRSAEVVSAAGAVGVTTMPTSEELEWQWDAPESGAYHFALRDENDWANRRPVRMTVKVTADAAPEVELELPGVGELITPQVDLAARVTARDAYGLTQVRTWARRNEDPPLQLPDEDVRGQREHRAALPVSTERVGIRPGDRLALWAEAADNDPAGPNVRSITPIVLEVLSRQDFLAAMAQREQELRQEFERLLSAQRGLQDLLARLVPELAASPTPTASQSQQLAGLVRRQAGHATRVLEISRRYAEILAEMQQNRASRAADERRIGDGVVTPLEVLGQTQFPEASAALEGLRVEVTPEGVGRVARLEAGLITAMEAVLANMLEWEGYREAVALLTELIELQEAAHGATQNAMETQLDEILDLDAFAEPDEGSAGLPVKP